MAEDRITAWVRLRDIARFRRDAKLAEEGIKGIEHAGDDATGPLGKLGGALSSLSDILPSTRTETGIMGLKLSSLITVVVLGLPFLVGFAGTATALAGSLGAAALGAGSLAVAVGGLALSLGPLAAISVGVLKNFTNLNTAYANWQKQVKAYGQNSTQAETALQRLNGLVGTMGKSGGTVLKAVEAWDKFKTGFMDANQGAIKNLYVALTGLFGLLRKMTPTFAYMAKVTSGALLKAFRAFGKAATSSGAQHMLRQLADAFAGLAGPLTKLAITLVGGFMRLAVAAAPALHWFVGELQKGADAFASWAKGSGPGAVISQFKSWWGLMKAIGGLLITILGGGAKQGQSLVVSLTKIVNRWNAWLKTTKGQASLRKFFADSITITVAFMKILIPLIVVMFKFARSVMPLFAKGLDVIRGAWKQVMDALKPAAPFWKNVLGPLLKGIAIGVIGSVVGAFKFLVWILKILAPVLGFIGKILAPLKGVFLFLGKVIGFVFGGAILKILGSLGKVSGLLRPLGAIFRLLAVPVRLAGGAVGFLFGKIGKLIGFFGRLAGQAVPLFRRAINGVVRFLTGVGGRFYNAGKAIWNFLKKGLFRAIGSGLGFAGDLAKKVANAVISLLNKAIPNNIRIPGPVPDIDLPNNPIPHLATGGVVSGPGSWITGEAGPELNTLINGRVSVQPLTPAVQTQSSYASLKPRADRTLVSKVYLRGRQIAEAVAKESESEQARRGNVKKRG